MLFFSYHQHSDVKEYIFQVLRPSILGDFFFFFFMLQEEGQNPITLQQGYSVPMLVKIQISQCVVRHASLPSR